MVVKLWCSDFLLLQFSDMAADSFSRGGKIFGRTVTGRIHLNPDVVGRYDIGCRFQARDVVTNFKIRAPRHNTGDEVMIPSNPTLSRFITGDTHCCAIKDHCNAETGPIRIIVSASILKQVGVRKPKHQGHNKLDWSHHLHRGGVASLLPSGNFGNRGHGYGC